jgi:hypothetical protein
MNSQFKVFLIIFVTFSALFIYASSPYGVTFAKQMLKKINLDVFHPETTDSTTLTVVEEEVVVPDSTSQRFLFIGDSMVEPLAYRFYDYCKQSGDTMYAVTWHGSTTVAWSGGTLDYYLNEVRPTYVIFCVGSNELHTKNMQLLNENLTRMLSKAGDLPCIFIGPPNTKPDNGLNDEIAKVFGKKRYFNSQTIEMERAKDHLHPTSKGARIWMDEVAEWMTSDSCIHPVVLNKPEGKQSWPIEHLEVFRVKEKAPTLNTPSKKS